MFRPLFHVRALAVVALLAGWLPSGHAQDPSAVPPPDATPTTDELRELERSLAADAPPDPHEGAHPADVGGVTLLPLSLIFDGAAAIFSQDKPLQTGGHDPRRTGFSLQQLELSAGAAVDPYFRFDTNVVFAQFGVEVEEAYATTLALPGRLQLKAGQFLTGIGRLNPTHPHSWSFVDQPLAIGRLFGSEGARGLGTEASWLLPAPWYVEARLGVQHPEGECCHRSLQGAQDLPLRSPLDLAWLATLRQFFAFDDDWSLAWGLSAWGGGNGSGLGNLTNIYATDVYLRYRPVADAERRSVSLQAEYFLRSRQLPGRLLVDHDGYAQVVAQLALRWDVGLRTELGTGLKDDPLDPAWTDTRTRHSAQVSFYPSHFSRLRLQGGLDRPAGRDPVWSAMLQLEVLVGHHGSHDF